MTEEKQIAIKVCDLIEDMEKALADISIALKQIRKMIESTQEI